MVFKIKLYFFVGIFGLGALSSAYSADLTQIIETHSMLLPFRDVDESTLVVLDLDNTVFESQSMLGSNQWLDAAALELASHGMPIREAFQNVGGLWEKLQSDILIRPVHEEVAPLIERTQKKKILVLALTVRRPAIAQVTKRQLRSLGIDFSKSKFSISHLDLNNEKTEDYSASFANGINFSGPSNNKGTMLYEFLKKTDYLSKIKRIHFVDDKEKNVKNVVDYFDRMNAQTDRPISVVGFRYGGADQKVKDFNADIALFQLNFWRQYNVVLPDLVAKTLLANKCDRVLGLLPK